MAGNGGEGGEGGEGGGSGDGTPAYTVGEATRITPGAANLRGVTSDNHAIYQDSTGLKAVPIEAGAQAQMIAEVGGNVAVKKNAVVIWGQPDYETNTGELSIWTAAGGTKSGGTTLLTEDLVSVSDDGQYVVYVNNLEETTGDLVISSIDLSAPQVVVAGIGRGGADTCRPNFAFVGSTAFAGYCAPGSQTAQIVRFDAAGDGTWAQTVIAAEADPMWSADENAQRVFYRSKGSEAFVWENGTAVSIDRSVGWGMVLPEGSAVLYTVSDQLRRSPFPELAPEPVVLRDFKVRAAFSPNYRYALYSTVVQYEGGKTQDLRLTTLENGSEPVVIADTATATLGRSIFTDDSKWVMWMTDVVARVGGTLHVRNTSNGEERTFTNVYDAAAAAKGVIVLTDNHSPEGVFPPVADLKIVDLNSGEEPELVEERITDGKAYFLDAAKEKLVYHQSGMNPDRTINPPAVGLALRTLR
jgi:hypothetical protein